MLIGQKILLGKIESSYGVDANPQASSDGIEAIGIKINYVGEELDRDIVRGTLSPVEARIGQKNVELQFTVELKGSGAVDTPPIVGRLLRACGFAETVNAGASVVYQPASAGLESMTFYLYEIEGSNALLHKILGAVGNVVFRFEAGKIASAEFSFKGKMEVPTDVAVPSSVGYEDTLPPIVEDCGFVLNGNSSLIVQSVEIDMANEVNKIDDLNSPYGIKGFRITGRKPNGSFNPEAVLRATYDFYSDWVNATSRALSLSVGDTAGNRFSISCPKVLAMSIGEGERDGVRTNEIPFKLAGDSGDDEITITFN